MVAIAQHLRAEKTGITFYLIHEYAIGIRNKLVVNFKILGNAFMVIINPEIPSYDLFRQGPLISKSFWDKQWVILPLLRCT